DTMELSSLLDKYESTTLTLPALPKSYIKVEIFDETFQKSIGHSQQNCLLPFARSESYSIPIRSSRTLIDVPRNAHNPHGVKEVHEIEFDIKALSTVFRFNPGDNIGILPINSANDVSFVLNKLSLNDLSDRKIEIQLIADSKKKLPKYLPLHTSIRECLSECLDLRTIPKKLFLRCLLEYLDVKERRVLEILCSKEGADEYKSERYLNGSTTFLAILSWFESWKQIPFHLLLEHLPRLLPRPYSIANSPLKDPNVFKIWFSVNDPPGVTTTMLLKRIQEAEEKVETNVCLYLRESQPFIYTENEIKDPVILIAAGVSLSPFLGFLEHRQEQLKLTGKDQLSNASLFFGSRYEKNNRCRDILVQHLQTGSLNDLMEAFSWDVDSKQRHVQDLIALNESLIAERLKADCRIYVCGNLDMTADIRKLLCKCLMTDSEKYETERQAEIFLQQLIDDKRYVESTWW
ncbi:Methionine synthase reductase, partial [Pseudolycoriella hygida]